jgi:hypothetical protein
MHAGEIGGDTAVPVPTPARPGSGSKGFRAPPNPDKGPNGPASLSPFAGAPLGLPQLRAGCRRTVKRPCGARRPVCCFWRKLAGEKDNYPNLSNGLMDLIRRFISEITAAVTAKKQRHNSGRISGTSAAAYGRSTRAKVLMLSMYSFCSNCQEPNRVPSRFDFRHWVEGGRRLMRATMPTTRRKRSLDQSRLMRPKRSADDELSASCIARHHRSRWPIESETDAFSGIHGGKTLSGLKPARECQHLRVTRVSVDLVCGFVRNRRLPESADKGCNSPDQASLQRTPPLDRAR